MSDHGRVLRSQSRLLRKVQDSISVASRKPRVVGPVDHTRVQGSARKLFTSPSTSTSSHPLHHEGDEDIELNDVEDDSSATPRAAGSVFENFVPNPELFQGFAGVAISGAARVATAVTNSLLPEFG